MFGLGKLASVLLGRRVQHTVPPGLAGRAFPGMGAALGTGAVSPEMKHDMSEPMATDMGALAGTGAAAPPPYIPQAPAPPMQMDEDMGRLGAGGVSKMTPGWLPTPGAGAGMKANPETPVPQPGEAPPPMAGMNRRGRVFRM